MITFLSVLLAPLVGIGLATMIIGVLLASNNIGDSVGDKICYAGTPRFIKSINNGRHSDCDNLVTGFQSGDAGNYNYSHHSSPHPYNKSTNTRKANVIGDGSGVTHSLSHASDSGVHVARISRSCSAPPRSCRPETLPP